MVNNVLWVIPVLYYRVRVGEKIIQYKLKRKIFNNLPKGRIHFLFTHFFTHFFCKIFITSHIYPFFNILIIKALRNIMAAMGG